MTLQEFSQKINVSEQALRHFIQEFRLDISECLTPDGQVAEDFLHFAQDHLDFLQQYEADLAAEKTPEQISEKISQPVGRVQAQIDAPRNIFQNGRYKASTSSFGIHRRLGGDYHFVYDYFGQQGRAPRQSFAGYRDFYFYLADLLAPFTDPGLAENWGIQRPAGILLYGPRGAGKIFWARKIAATIGYDFMPISRSALGTSFENGVRRDFTDYLAEVAKPKTMLFLEDIDEVLETKTSENSYTNERVKDVLLLQMQKFAANGVLVAGSATSLAQCDPETMAPGRFDVQIPVFPPDAAERAEIIAYYLTLGLAESSPLLAILRYNGADSPKFWMPAARQMPLFSVTMLIDFTQILKKRLRTRFTETQSTDISLSPRVLDAMTREAATKRTDTYLNEAGNFLREATENAATDFPERIRELRDELEQFRVREKPARKIGFDTEHLDKE